MAKYIPAAARKELKDTVLKGGMEQPRLEAIIQHFVELMGGEREMAKALLLEFRKSDCTPATRTRILDLVLQWMGQTSKQFGTPEGMGLVSDEDLERAIEAKMKSIQEKMAKDEG